MWSRSLVSEGSLPLPAGTSLQLGTKLWRKYFIPSILIILLLVVSLSMMLSTSFMSSQSFAGPPAELGVHRHAGTFVSKTAKWTSKGAPSPNAVGASERQTQDGTPVQTEIRKFEPSPTQPIAVPPVSTPTSTVEQGRTVEAGPVATPRSTAVSSYESDANTARRNAVRGAFSHAWSSYARLCFGRDELRPMSGSCNDWLGQGLTLVDSLDSLKIMGFDDEFQKARDWVANSLRFDGAPRGVSLFETTIRILGGLLSAYDLTHDKVFLNKAQDLGNRLLPAFETRSGLPKAEINLVHKTATSAAWTGGASLIAEVGTVQLELTYLSKMTGNPVYADKAQKVIDHLDKLSRPYGGLYPIFIHPESGQFVNQKITFGAMGDSFYEYLLKMWIMTGRKDEQYQKMYLQAMDAAFQHLLTQSPDGLWYLADLENGHKQHKMDHLVCFAPAMIALGVQVGIVSGSDAQARHLKVAKDLTRTCYEMYARSPSKVAPEFVNFVPNLMIGEPTNHLRPEAAEAMFVLWRVTHDQQYRDWGWDIFQAFEANCRVQNGYAGLHNVHSPQSKEDKMESFFLAETLKYLYLLFSADDVVPIDGPQTKVFNTECHPLSAWK